MAQEVAALPFENGVARGFLNSTNLSLLLSTLFPFSPLLSLFLSYVFCKPIPPFLAHPPLLRKNREKERKKKKEYYAVVHPVTCLFDATKLDPFLVGQEYTYSCRLEM